MLWSEWQLRAKDKEHVHLSNAHSSKTVITLPYLLVMAAKILVGVKS